jgi:hypothetical protein
LVTRGVRPRAEGTREAVVAAPTRTIDLTGMDDSLPLAWTAVTMATLRPGEVVEDATVVAMISVHDLLLPALRQPAART